MNIAAIKVIKREVLEEKDIGNKMDFEHNEEF
jgi:hypothetical protein